MPKYRVESNELVRPWFRPRNINDFVHGSDPEPETNTSVCTEGLRSIAELKKNFEHWIKQSPRKEKHYAPRTPQTCSGGPRRGSYKHQVKSYVMVRPGFSPMVYNDFIVGQQPESHISTPPNMPSVRGMVDNMKENFTGRRTSKRCSPNAQETPPKLSRKSTAVALPILTIADLRALYEVGVSRKKSRLAAPAIPRPPRTPPPRKATGGGPKTFGVPPPPPLPGVRQGPVTRSARAAP